MTIPEYLEEHDMSIDEFAKLVGLSRSTIYRLINKEYTQQLDKFKRIVVRTENKVDFWDL